MSDQLKDRIDRFLSPDSIPNIRRLVLFIVSSALATVDLALIVRIVASGSSPTSAAGGFPAWATIFNAAVSTGLFVATLCWYFFRRRFPRRERYRLGLTLCIAPLALVALNVAEILVAAPHVTNKLDYMAVSIAFLPADLSIVIFLQDAFWAVHEMRSGSPLRPQSVSPALWPLRSPGRRGP